MGERHRDGLIAGESNELLQPRRGEKRLDEFPIVNTARGLGVPLQLIENQLAQVRGTSRDVAKHKNRPNGRAFATPRARRGAVDSPRGDG